MDENNFGDIIDKILNNDPEILKQLEMFEQYLETIKILKKLKVLDIFLEALNPKYKEFFTKISKLIE